MDRSFCGGLEGAQKAQKALKSHKPERYLFWHKTETANGLETLELLACNWAKTIVVVENVNKLEPN